MWNKVVRGTVGNIPRMENNGCSRPVLIYATAHGQRDAFMIGFVAYYNGGQIKGWYLAGPESLIDDRGPIYWMDLPNVPERG